MDRQFTLEEYHKELEEEIIYPDPSNPEDPNYYRKYAHNMPPLKAYTLRPIDYDKVNYEKPRHNDRRVYNCWNNLTDFEKEYIKTIKKGVLMEGMRCPEGFNDREVLKFI